MGRLSGKSAIVTAAAAGIGRAIALAFAREGAEVLATDIDEGSLRELAGVNGLRTCPLDVTKAAAVERVLSRGCDILCNAAGVVPSGTILDCAPDEWRSTFAVNVDGMFHTVRAALPHMLERGGGSIINIASAVSSLKGAPRRAAYGASKAAVVGLTKAVAADFVGCGIRCNAICPGTVDSPSLAARIAGAADPEAARRDFLARQPMGRFGAPEEVAHLAVYLAADESAFMTGAAIVLDGGWTA